MIRRKEKKEFTKKAKIKFGEGGREKGEKRKEKRGAEAGMKV